MSQTGSAWEDNLIQIGVYFQSLNTRMISEEPKYEVLLNTSRYKCDLFVVIYVDTEILNNTFSY